MSRLLVLLTLALPLVATQALACGMEFEEDMQLADLLEAVDAEAEPPASEIHTVDALERFEAKTAKLVPVMIQSLPGNPALLSFVVDDPPPVADDGVRIVTVEGALEEALAATTR